MREELREAIENSGMTMSRGRLLTAAVLMALASGAAAQTTPADPFAPGAAAQNAAPASDKPAAAPAAKPVHRKPDGLTVVVTNKRFVGLVELRVGAAGDPSPPKVAGPLAFGRKTVVHLKPAKDCLYDVRGHFADDADTEQLGVELCKDKVINLTDE